MGNREHPLKLKTDFKDLKNVYANESMISLTDNDLSIIFGLTTFDEEGSDIIKMHTSIKLSHQHAQRLHDHIGDMLAKLKTLKEQ